MADAEHDVAGDPARGGTITGGDQVAARYRSARAKSPSTPSSSTSSKMPRR